MSVGLINISLEQLDVLVRKHDPVMADCVATDRDGKALISVRAYRKLLEPQRLSNKATKKLVHDFRKKREEIHLAIGLREGVSPPTAAEKEASRILKRKFGIPLKLGMHVVRGRITKEVALARIEARKQRKAEKAERKRAELEQWKPAEALPVWNGVSSWPRTPVRLETPPEGDIYDKGRRLPGSFGTRQ
jgi:hypothetical protein